MRKLLTFILIILLVVLAVQMVVNGIEIGDFKILSVKQVQEESLILDEKIAEAETATQTKYKSELNKMQQAVNNLNNSKKRYEELVAITSDSNFQLASREENYRLEYLYFQLGAIANQNNVGLKIDVSTSSSGLKDAYDVTLTATYEAPTSDESGYVKITDFIYDVENDSTLGFKVEDFSLEPYSVGNKTITVTELVTDAEGNTTEKEVSKSVPAYGLKGIFTAKNLSIYDMKEIIATQNPEISLDGTATNNVQ